MKDTVIIRSKTINNESVPVTVMLIEPFTGEKDLREITRSVVFNNFQAEVSVDLAKSLIEQNPDEFFIVDVVSDLSEKAEKIVKKEKERLEGFKCENCGAEFKSKAGLLGHIRFNHPKEWKEWKEKNK